MTKVVVVLNGIPRKARRYYDEFHPILDERYETLVLTTTGPGTARDLAGTALEKDPDFIVIAGGDGTVHEVIHGLLKASKGEPVRLPLAILPLGNGNDFARTIGTRNTLDVISNLGEAVMVAVDAGEIRCLDVEKNPCVHYFINIADIGASPEVVRQVSTYGWMRSSPVAYYRAVLTTLLRFSPVAIEAVTPEWNWKGAVRSFAVANGTRHGNGLYVTPDARLDDGIFDCFIAGEVGVFTFIFKTRDLLKGRKIDHPRIHYRKARRISLTADKDCLIQADGELVGYLPADIEILPGRFWFLT